MAADLLAPELSAAAEQASRADQPPASRVRLVFWLALTIAICLGFALRTSRPALLNPLVIHDDVRQHVFWVPRLHDPSLFPNDWIADYYQSQAPVGYQAVYWLATLAVDAVLASKLLPLVLTVVLAVAGFALAWSLWRRAEAAALSSILLAWSVWQYDDLASATPRAYALPLLTIQLTALVSGRWWLALAMLPVQAVFYPLGCALAVVTLGLWVLWTNLTPQPAARREYRLRRHHLRRGEGEHNFLSLWARGRVRARGWLRALPIGRLVWLGVATLVALVLVGLGQLDAARFGPTVSAAEARRMPEFQQGGRAAYFISDPYEFWIESSRSGFALKPRDAWLKDLPALTIPFGLAAVLGGWVLAGCFGWTTAPAVPRSGRLLVILLGGSLLLFDAAHVLLFALYLPARHVQFSLPLVWALAGGLCWVLLGDGLATRLGRRLDSRLRTRLGSLSGLTGAEAFGLFGVALLTLHAPPPGDFYVIGRHPALYAYLRQSPPDTLVGALPADSNILPMLGQRSILTSFEHALPYQPGYYEPLRQRTEAFRAAYFAPTLAPLLAILDEYGVDVVIADAEALERRRRAERERPPALEGLLDRCGVLRERDLVVMAADCIRVGGVRP
jgi:hypothetical protein